MLDLSLEKITFFLIFLSELLLKTHQFEFVVLKNDTNFDSSKIVKRQASSSNVPEIKEFIVTTNVANRFAETSIINRVENLDSISKQTAFSVVLPERAFISGFYMEIKGIRYTAYVLDKEEAKKIFDQIVSTGQTAGHVSVSARYSNRFTVNLNIEGDSKVIFNLNYEELLQREESQYEIITNIQPGQTVKKLRVEVRINESLPLSFVRTPSLRSGNNAVLKHNANLDPHAKVWITNTSALIVFEPDISRQLKFACAGLGNKVYDGFAGQFVVKYDVDRTAEGGETIYQDGFLLNFFAPKNFEPLPKHIVFILDTSGSMEGPKISQLIKAMLKIMPQLNNEDIFSIVQYESYVHVWNLDSPKINVFQAINPDFANYGNLAEELKDTYIPPAHAATKENIEKVMKLIEQLVEGGGTNSIGALEIGLLVAQKAQIQYPNKYIPILVFLTDGLPNVGNSSPNTIIKKTIDLNTAGYNAPIFSLGFGEDADMSFLKKLSAKTGVAAKKISDAEDSAFYLEKFYKTISDLLLKNVTFNNLPKSAEATQTNFPLFFKGSELVFAAKGVPENESQHIGVSAMAKQGLVNLESQLGVPLTKLEKVWAYLTIKELADKYIETGNTTYSELALNLALNYSLVSDFTSLVVVRPDSKGGVDFDDASLGVFPEPPGDLPMCNNITEWINKKYGADETVILESDFGVAEPITTTTETPTTITTTTEMPTTTEKIITCKESTYGCCYDGVTFSPGPNADGCDPVPRAESCSLHQDKGTCTNVTTKWFYSVEKHQCRLFRYGGCGGNGNRFATKEICQNTCVNVNNSERCKLPISLGSCNRRVLHWFYDKYEDECVKYLYGGCYGNSNRFISKQECLRTCSPLKLQKTLKDLCFQPKDKGTPSCRRFELNYYFDKTIGQCIKFWFSGCGGNDNRFTSKDVCEKMCIYSKNRAICNAPPVKGSCNGYYPIYYFDTNTSTCKKFIFGGCGGNRNKFVTQKECEDFCLGA